MSRFNPFYFCAMLLLAQPIAANADQPQTDPQGPPPATISDPTLTPREISEREQEYLAALKKCEPLGESDRQKCVESVKNKYGLM